MNTASLLLPENYLDICIAKQEMSVIAKGTCFKKYTISTAKNGAGELKGSECTPRGWHSIRAKIGGDQAIYSVFKARRPTGEIYSQALGEQYPERDWILSRILWLGGLEAGKNRYGDVDSTWRYIYIHGTPDHLIDGRPLSHGCIRMNNTDLVELFASTQVGCKVYIHE